MDQLIDRRSVLFGKNNNARISYDTNQYLKSVYSLKLAAKNLSVQSAKPDSVPKQVNDVQGQQKRYLSLTDGSSLFSSANVSADGEISSERLLSPALMEHTHDSVTNFEVSTPSLPYSFSFNSYSNYTHEPAVSACLII
jgi:hypothetical protein